MFLLLNTFVGGPQTRGSVMSRHRSAETAFDAMAKAQRAIKRRHGANAWLSMIVVRVDASQQKSVSQWVPIGVGSLVAEPEL